MHITPLPTDTLEIKPKDERDDDIHIVYTRITGNHKCLWDIPSNSLEHLRKIPPLEYGTKCILCCFIRHFLPHPVPAVTTDFC